MTLSLDMYRSHENGGASARAGQPMRKSGSARSLMGLDWLSYNLVFALAYPAFCLAELLRRRDAGVSAQTSLFAEARKIDVRSGQYRHGRPSPPDWRHGCPPGCAT